MDDCITKRECDTCKVLYDEKIDAIDDRLKEVEASVKQIHELTVSVREMAVSVQQMAKQLEKQGLKLEAIEAEPAQKWKSAVWLVLAGLIGAALSYFVSRLGL